MTIYEALTNNLDWNNIATSGAFYIWKIMSYLVLFLAFIKLTIDSLYTFGIIKKKER